MLGARWPSVTPGRSRTASKWVPRGVSSRNYPHFDMNPNTDASLGDADTFEVATHRVWCCAAYPSRITLPVAGSSRTTWGEGEGVSSS